MAITLNLNQSQSVAGTQTANYTAPSQQFVEIRCETTIPQNSGLQIVISKNAVPIVTVGGTTPNPTPTQPSIFAGTRLLLQAADVLSVALSSSNYADSLPSAVQSVISLFQKQ